MAGEKVSVGMCHNVCPFFASEKELTFCQLWYRRGRAPTKSTASVGEEAEVSGRRGEEAESNR